MKRLLRAVVVLMLAGSASWPGTGISGTVPMPATHGARSQFSVPKKLNAAWPEETLPEKMPRGPRPDAYLSSSFGEVQASGGLGCWDNGSSGVCACGQAGYLNEPLATRSGEPLLLRFTKADRPDQLTISLDGKKVDVLPTNPAVIPVDVPSGRHYLDIGSRWTQGDLSYAAKFDVR